MISAEIKALLKKQLIGQYYIRFDLGDAIGLAFDGFYLVTQRIRTPDDDHIINILTEYYPKIERVLDQEEIPAVLALIAGKYRKISDILIADDATLTLYFENGASFSCVTDVDIVDWQWAINQTGGDPCHKFQIGCFNAGEVLICE